MIFSDKLKFQYEFVDPCVCNAWVATAVIGSAVIGAGAQIIGSQSAADAQRDSANAAIKMQQDQYQQTRADLSPYRQIGQTATDQMTTRLSDLTSPIVMDQAALEKTPGYQWNLAQGQRGVTNSAAARGLASSGAALKGAATFATGLADSTYQNQFNNANTNQTNAYTRLKGLIDTGTTAATVGGTLGEKAAYNSGVAEVGAGNAQAGADNRIGTSIANMASNISGYAQSQGGLYGTQQGRITTGTSTGHTPFS